MEMEKMMGSGPHVKPPRQPNSIRSRVHKPSRLEKVILVIFYTPPLQNHYFWVPVEAKMEPQCRLEAIFVAFEKHDGRAMLFRALLETFLHL